MIRLLAASVLLAVPGAVSAQAYVPVYERDAGIASGTELVMVYIGASHCFPCVQPEYKAALEQAKVRLAEQAEADGKAFVAIGVSIDYDPEVGYDFLADSGKFDELAIGRNWFNASVLEHLVRAEGAEDRTLALPTVVVYEREARMGDTLEATAPRYLKYIVGSRELPTWAEAGAPLE